MQKADVCVSRVRIAASQTGFDSVGLDQSATVRIARLPGRQGARILYL